MNYKRRKEIEEIALNVYKLLNNTKGEKLKENQEDCNGYNDFKIDNLSKKELFAKIVDSLPKVYNEDNPYELLTLTEWLSKVTRNNLIGSHLSQEESALFDEMNVKDIKRYFAAQLQEHYYTKYERVKALHIKILKNYYNNEKGEQ